MAREARRGKIGSTIRASQETFQIKEILRIPGESFLRGLGAKIFEPYPRGPLGPPSGPLGAPRAPMGAPECSTDGSPGGREIN